MPREKFSKLTLTYDDQVTRPGVIAGSGVPAGPTVITFTDSNGNPQQISDDWFKPPKNDILMAVKNRDYPNINLSYSALCELAWGLENGTIPMDKAEEEPKYLEEEEPPVEENVFSKLIDAFNTLDPDCYDSLISTVLSSEISETFESDADVFNAICMMIADHLWTHTPEDAPFKVKVSDTIASILGENSDEPEIDMSKLF